MAIVVLGMCGTYLSDYLVNVNWFGDSTYTKTDYIGKVTVHVKWGARHYWYNFTVVAMIILSVARAVAKVYLIVEKEES